MARAGSTLTVICFTEPSRISTQAIQTGCPGPVWQERPCWQVFPLQHLVAVPWVFYTENDSGSGSPFSWGIHTGGNSLAGTEKEGSFRSLHKTNNYVCRLIHLLRHGDLSMWGKIAIIELHPHALLACVCSCQNMCTRGSQSTASRYDLPFFLLLKNWASIVLDLSNYGRMVHT